MIREFFYLQKSDRKVILTLLAVIAVALLVIYLTGEEQPTTNALTPADTISQRDTTAKHSKERTRTVYVRTKVVYRDTAYRRGKALMDRRERDSIVATYQPKIHEGEVVVLNTADTSALKTVPGIGPYFARKVVEYGERLGGYVSVDQLGEIEDFPLDAKRFLIIQEAQPRLLNINQLSLNELKRHPYINFYQAKAITDYRRLHGPIKSLNDLRLSRDFPPEAIERLLPYVVY